MKEYRISDINDLLDVPDDRIDELFADMREWVKATKPIVDLSKAICKGLDLSEVSLISKGFVWVDDGKRGMSGFNLEIKTQEREQA